MEAFQDSGYLGRDVDFSRGMEGGQPLSNLLMCQWDKRCDLGYPTSKAPGVFLENRPASTAGTAQIAMHLRSSSLPALLRLANVLDCRVENGDLSDRVMQWQRSSQESHDMLLGDLAAVSNLESFEGMAGEDLTQAPYEMVTLLKSYLESRYVLAALALEETILHQSDRSPPIQYQRDLFVRMLTAVCSMAGATDV